MLYAVLAVLLAVASAATYPVVNSGYYCASSGLVPQAGPFNTANDCGDKCASKSFSYFSYVPSSKQCLCSNTQDKTNQNVGASCYSISPPPTAAPTRSPTRAPTRAPTRPPTAAPTAAPTFANPYPLVNSGYYCASSGLTVQAGPFNSAKDCGDKCASKSFSYFSYVAGSKQCLCSNTQDKTNQNVGASCYLIGPPPTAAPTRSPTRTPTAAPTRAPTTAAPTSSYSLCQTNYYCGSNNAIVTQANPQDVSSCFTLCSANPVYKYFNLVSNGQCQCVPQCQWVKASGVNAYAISPNACPPLPSLRH